MHESRTITFAIAGPLERSDLPGLFKRIGLLLEHSGASFALCDVSNATADAVTVEALAGLQLEAGKNACQMKLHKATADLRRLMALMGLQDVLAD